MSQRARHPPSDESERERQAYENMLSEMQVHREIIRSIRVDLRSINLSKITDIEVKRYRQQINYIVECIEYSTIKDSKNILMVNRFVKAVAAFEKTGNLIIRKFNLALSRWQESRNPRKSAKQRNEAEEVYQEILNDCRTELGNLLNVFKDF
jgi:hypothetical protein